MQQADGAVTLRQRGLWPPLIFLGHEVKSSTCPALHEIQCRSRCIPSPVIWVATASVIGRWASTVLDTSEAVQTQQRSVYGGSSADVIGDWPATGLLAAGADVVRVDALHAWEEMVA